MGDRCYVQITCRKSDAHLFYDLGFVSAWGDCDVPNCVDLEDTERHPPTDDDEWPAPFVGWHGEGGEYGGFAFAFDGHRFLDLPITHDGDLFVRFDEAKGEPVADDIEECRVFSAFRTQVKALLEVPVPEPPQPALTACGVPMES